MKFRLKKSLEICECAHGFLLPTIKYGAFGCFFLQILQRLIFISLKASQRAKAF